MHLLKYAWDPLVSPSPSHLAGDRGILLDIDEINHTATVALFDSSGVTINRSDRKFSLGFNDDRLSGEMSRKSWFFGGVGGDGNGTSPGTQHRGMLSRSNRHNQTSHSKSTPVGLSAAMDRSAPCTTSPLHKEKKGGSDDSEEENVNPQPSVEESPSLPSLAAEEKHDLEAAKPASGQRLRFEELSSPSCESEPGPQALPRERRVQAALPQARMITVPLPVDNHTDASTLLAYATENLRCVPIQKLSCESPFRFSRTLLLQMH